MIANIANRICPICQNKEVEVLHTQKFKLNSTNILPDSYDVVCCNNCGFTYANTKADQTIYNEYYLNFSKYENQDSTVSSGGGASVWDKMRLENTAKDILAFSNKNDKIIDIGCANGGLLKELKQLGYTNLTGLDPSEKCVNYVNDLGIKCIQGELFTADQVVDGEKFDIVLLSHVLEHIYDLKGAVIVLKKLLTPTGKIYIEVPDAANYCNHFIVSYYYFDIEHINHFDKNSLKNLFQTNGLKLLNSSNKTFLVNENTNYPATFSVFQNNDINYTIEKSETVKNQVLQYVELSKKNNSEDKINQLIAENTEIIIFGAGNFTARLLENTRLKNCNIKGFVDNDKTKQGQDFGSKKVYSSDYLTSFNGTIVICSALFHQQIYVQLKNEMKLKNEVVIIN